MLEVDVADNLEEAILSLKAQPHRLAVLDLSLSPSNQNNYDGLRVLDAVRRLDPNCRAIFLTGFATVEPRSPRLQITVHSLFYGRKVSTAVSSATSFIAFW